MPYTVNINRRRKLLLLKKKLVLIHEEEKRKRKRPWVSSINQTRVANGVYDNLLQELRSEEHERRHHQYLRMSVSNFDYLLSLIRHKIEKQDTVMRPALRPGLKLAVTLHHLAEGASHVSIANHYRLGRSTVSSIIYDTCKALWDVLQPIYLRPPGTPEDWLTVAHGFKKWNFPNCIGSVDGKHITIPKPRRGGSMYHNYKQRESIVLMAVCDSNYKFLIVDIGKPGSRSDGGVWDASPFAAALAGGKANIPPARPLPGDETQTPTPFVLVGDEAFPLKSFLMRPYPGRQLTGDKRRIFNYRLSRARRVVENAFGIMAHRWRLLLKTIVADPKRCECLVKAMCVLHNFLRTVSDTSYTPAGFADTVSADGSVNDGFWRSSHGVALLNQPRSFSRNAAQQAIRIREHFAEYFVSAVGSLPWQLNHIHSR